MSPSRHSGTVSEAAAPRVDDIWHFATIDRVQNVMRPYIEATV